MAFTDLIQAVDAVLDILWKLATVVVGVKLFMERRRREGEQVSMTRALYVDNHPEPSKPHQPTPPAPWRG